MELVLDNTTETALSDHEIERGKPMPNLTHGSIQLNVGFELKLNYGTKYRIASEVLLATMPDASTPDVVLYPARALNFVNETAKQTVPPLLTIEITGPRSPSQSTSEMVDKAYRYFAFGVKSCWIVFPEMKGVAVYSTPDTYAFFHDADRLVDTTLGIELELSKIFA